MPSPAADFDALVAAGAAAPAGEWDFTFLYEHMSETPTPWDYAASARRLLAGASRAVDLGTGSGYDLADAVARAASTAHVVTAEAWPPILPVAARTLAAAGIGLIQYAAARENTAMAPGTAPVALPFATASVDLVLARHESFEPDEVARVLRPGGVFLTQQVGSDEAATLAAQFGAPPAAPFELATIVAQLGAAGLEVVAADEARPPARFHDVAGIVFYLRALPWTVPDFDVDRHRETLVRLHVQILTEGSFTTHAHRFAVEARKG